MSRNGLLAGAAICLTLGLVDLAVLDVWLAPAAFAPAAPPGEASPPPRLSPPTSREDQPRPPQVGKEPRAPAPPAPAAPAPVPPPTPAPAPPAPPAESSAPPPSVTRRPSEADKTMVYFATGQSALSPEAAETLRQAAAKLRETPDLLVVIEGHADQRGEPDRNSQLSLLRAGSAAALLKQEGLESSRIQVRGVGSARPADSRNTPEAWARNRRVEVQTRVRRQ